MSQTGYSKVQIYSSSTATNTPSASNLTNDTNGSELAINITDGKLFYKDNGGTVQVIASKASNSGSFTTLSGSTSTTTPIVQSSGSLLLNTNGTTTAVTIDTAQNVGIGVTPSAWYTVGGYKSIEIARVGNGITSLSASDIQVRSNCFLNASGVSTYANTGFAANYEQYNSNHYWYIAPSGTAGNAITFTTAMTLDNSGNLLVGASSSTGRVNIQGTGSNLVMKPGSNARPTPLAGDSGFYSDAGYGDVICLGNTYGSGKGYMAFFNGTTQIGGINAASATTVNYLTFSDRRLKTNIATLTNSGAIIDALQPRSFNWIEDNSLDAGFIADEFQTVIPKAVQGTKDEVDAEGKPVYQQLAVSSPEIIAYLVAEIQSLRARLKAANIA